MIKASWEKYNLIFNIPAGTSRGILKTKDIWLIFISDSENPDKIAVGECNMFQGLSYDDKPNYKDKLSEICSSVNQLIHSFHKDLIEWPSIRFGLEIALKSLHSPNPEILFPSDFTHGNDHVSINGLVWMGEYSFMKNQIIEKINSGYHCIKIKIGAIDFNLELQLLKLIRTEFSDRDIEIRVDANGAFAPKEALEKLKRLSDFRLHSIEQPIRQGLWEKMAHLCETSPLPIALDEELIGIFGSKIQEELIKTIKPQYIILKPSLLGGFEASENWIRLAKNNSIGWWITSALESNIGLNAIAQWAYALNNKIPQGLGTGALYSNNFNSPLYIKDGTLNFKNNK